MNEYFVSDVYEFIIYSLLEYFALGGEERNLIFLF